MVATPLPGVEDILYHILAHLAADLKVANVGYFDRPDSQSTRQTLARLARAHSSFTQPALAVLWRCLRSDRSLLHLLCVVGIAHESPRKDQGNLQNKPPLEMRITPATHDSGWIRFQEYASLVREITLDPFVHAPHMPSKPLQDTFWCQLSSALGNGTPILPRLRVVTLLSLATPFRFDALDMGPLRLLNPSIREFNIMFPQTGAEAETPLRQVLSTSLSSIPNLESLSVQAPLPVLDIKSLPQSHPRLRRLELDPGFQVDSNRLTILASFPSLEHLSISLSDLAPPNLPVTFPRLRSLAVSSYEFSAIGPLIAHMDAPQLQTFSLSETHEDSGPTYQELPGHLRTLVAKCPRLTAFRWNSTNRHLFDRDSADPGTFTIQPELTLAALIAPLLALRTLRTFAACFRGPLVLYSPSDLRAVAEAWPALETFHLHHDRDSREDGGSNSSDAGRYADLESIVCFARRCPRLRDLRIPTVRVHRDPDINADASLAGAPVVPPSPTVPHWQCTVFVEHILCPGGQPQDINRREALLRGWMQKVLPSATVSFPLVFELSHGFAW